MRRKSIRLFLELVFIISLLTGCTGKMQVTDSAEIIYMQGSKVIDVNSKSEMIGIADYVFVAKVNDFVETKYLYSSPISVYSVTVVENIKGNLKKNEPIELYKDGGVTEDGKMIMLYENDFLPEKDNYYIFFASAQKDGWIGISGENTNILINASTEDEIQSSEEYKSVMNALKDEVKFERERYRSKYEE